MVSIGSRTLLYLSAFLSSLSAVAPLKASMRGAQPKITASCSLKLAERPAGGHCDISTGKETMQTAKATIAGLNGFCPRPPYRCLATMMAKAVPVTISHHGPSGGKVNAINQAVTTALPSPRNSASGLPRSLSISASDASAVRVASVIWTRMAGPICQT